MKFCNGKFYLPVLIFLAAFLLNCDDFSFYDIMQGSIDQEMNVRMGTTQVPDGAAGIFAGAVDSGASLQISFTIENSGSLDDLVLSGTPYISVTGDGFSLASDAVSPIAASGSADFEISFAPDTPGTKTGTISIANNDTDENPYDFTITCYSLTMETLTVESGFSSSGGSLDAADLALVQSSDDNRLTVDKNGMWISFSFSNPTNPPAYIDSAVVFCEHHEESSFDEEIMLWMIGTGWQGSETIWSSSTPPVHTSESVDSWDVTDFVPLAEINDSEFCILNNENKRSFQDYIYLEIKYSP